MPDKQSFLQSINSETIFDGDFFKKLYGYSVYDSHFLEMVARKFVCTGRMGGIQAYNEWLKAWKAENDKKMKPVAHWYVGEVNRQYGLWVKSESERMVKACKQKEIDLLQRKKILLLTKKSILLTGN